MFANTDGTYDELRDVSQAEEARLSDTGDVVLRAEALNEAGRPHDAIALLQTALASDPHDPQLLEALARSQLEVDPAAAYETAGRLIEAAPEDPDAHYLAASASLDLERGKRALYHAEQAAALAPWWAPLTGCTRMRSRGARASGSRRSQPPSARWRSTRRRSSGTSPQETSSSGMPTGARRRGGTAAHSSSSRTTARPSSISSSPRRRAGGIAPAFVDAGALLRFDPRDADARSRIDELVYTTLVHLQWIAAVLAIVALGIRGD